MRKGKLTAITIYCIFVLLSSMLMSCGGLYSDPTEEIDIELPVLQDDEPEEEEPIPEEGPVPEPTAYDSRFEAEEDIIPEPEEEPEEPMEELMKLLPIESYPHYAFFDGKLKGLSDDKAETCGLMDEEGKQYPIDEFFIIPGNAIYFSTHVTEIIDEKQVEKKLFYSQLDDTLEEMKEKDFPAVPALSRSTMQDGNYKIQDKEYHGVPGNVVSNVEQTGFGNTSYLLVDGFYLNDKGLWFSVPEAISIRLSGLYFYPVNCSRIQRVGEYGRIY